MSRSQFYEMQDWAEVTCVVCVYVWCVYVCVCVFSGRVCGVCAHVGCVYMVCVWYVQGVGVYVQGAYGTYVG